MCTKIEAPVTDHPLPSPLPAEGELRLLPPERLTFSRATHGQLRMTVSGWCSFRSVRLVRCFPATCPDSHLSVRDALGERAPEIGLIADPGRLSAAAREAVREHLTGSCLLPEIREVTALRREFGFLYWKVDTDRGARDFATRDSQDSVQRLPDGGAVIADTDDCRYRLPEPSALGKATRALLAAFSLA